MKRTGILLAAFMASLTTAFAQEHETALAMTDLPAENIRFRPIDKDDDVAERAPQDVYKINWPVDGPVTAVGAAWSLYAFTRIYNKDTSTLAEIAALNKDDINGFDRWAAGMYDPDAAKTSDYLFYGSMPLPILLLIDKNIRKDAPAVGFLYLESMAITGLLYTGSTFLTNRYRPESYTTELPMAEKVDGGYRNSFFAGHVALVATSTFFCAKVYSDYHPDSKLKYALWGGAIAATGATAYLRHKAGKHFPTDIIVGTAVGTLSGILVPHLHKRKPGSEQAWMLSPTIGNGYGLAFTYNIR